MIDRPTWIHWEAERPRAVPEGGASDGDSTSSSEASDTDSTYANYDSDLECDLESLMDTDNELVRDQKGFDWENYPLPSVDELRAELTLPSWLSNPLIAPQSMLTFLLIIDQTHQCTHLPPLTIHQA